MSDPHDPHHFYLFHPELDDSEQWQQGIRDCEDCGYVFAYACRVDQLPPACPRCSGSQQWVRKPTYLS